MPRKTCKKERKKENISVKEKRKKKKLFDVFI
jgi:hypothetical protein